MRGWVRGLVDMWANGFVAVGSCHVFTVSFTPLVLSPLGHGASTYDLGTHLLLQLLLYWRVGG